VSRVQLDVRIRREIVQFWSRAPEVQRVLLFGSRARGDAEERSDIDIAIEAPDISPTSWVKLVIEMEDHINTLLPMDVVRFEEASTELKGNILREGKVLYERAQN
jgi:predicted nucleotidyltransferase